MKDKIIKHLSKKGSLDEKLNFLTNYCLYSKTEGVFETCEDIRFELVCEADKNELRNVLRNDKKSKYKKRSHGINGETGELEFFEINNEGH